MVKINRKNTQGWIKGLLLISLSILMYPAFAIDNPDAPDFIRKFEDQEEVYLKLINTPHNSSKDYLIAYDDYLKFLDDELNKAYQLIKLKLSIERQQELKKSQRIWVKFRNAEFELIKNNWNRQNFGSSASLSRGSYKSTIIKNRVLQLLHYVKNY